MLPTDTFDLCLSASLVRQDTARASHIRYRMQVTEDEFTEAAAGAPQLMLFADKVVEKGVEQHPSRAHAVAAARSVPPAANGVRRDFGTDDDDDGNAVTAHPATRIESTSSVSRADDDLLQLVRRLETELAGKDREVCGK